MPSIFNLVVGVKTTGYNVGFRLVNIAALGLGRTEEIYTCECRFSKITLNGKHRVMVSTKSLNKESRILSCSHATVHSDGARQKFLKALLVAVNVIYL